MYNRRVAVHGSPVVASLGDIVLDVLARAEGPMQYATDARGSVMLSPGGCAANFAVWIARLGLVSRLLGAVGTDPAGALLLGDLDAEGVRTGGIARIPGRSSTVLALVDEQGERTMLTDRQTTLQLGPQHIAPEALDETDHLHLTAYSFFDPGPEAAAWRAAELARGAGATISLDLSSSGLLRARGPHIVRGAIRRLAPDFLFGNEDEYAVLTDRTEPDELLLAAGELAQCAVVKRGAHGCVLLHLQSTKCFPAEQTAVVDTTGAGDAFDAAWVAAVLRGGDPSAACRQANRLAAAVVSAPGARREVSWRAAGT